MWGPINGRSLGDQDPRYLICPVPSRPTCWPQIEQIWLWVISFHALNQRHWYNNYPNIVLLDAYHCKTIFCHRAVKGQYRFAETHSLVSGRGEITEQWEGLEESAGGVRWWASRTSGSKISRTSVRGVGLGQRSWFSGCKWWMPNQRGNTIFS